MNPLLSSDLFDAATLAGIAVFIVLPTLVIGAVYVRDWIRDRHTDRLMRRGMREAWRRGLLKDGDQ